MISASFHLPTLDSLSLSLTPPSLSPFFCFKKENKGDVTPPDVSFLADWSIVTAG